MTLTNTENTSNIYNIYNTSQIILINPITNCYALFHKVGRCSNLHSIN